MTQFFNRSTEKEKGRFLRRSMPRAEVILWSKLKGKQVLGHKFRRQYSVGSYLLDFYCPALKLAIEIDGDSHFGEGSAEYDSQRQAFIESFSITFLRFTNKEVVNNLDGVLERIRRTAEGITPYGPPSQGGQGVPSWERGDSGEVPFESREVWYETS